MSFKRSVDQQAGGAAPGSTVHGEGRQAGESAGGLAAALLVDAVGGRKMRNFAAAAARLGGAAAIGGLALRAYDNYRAGGMAGCSAAGQTMPINWQNLSEEQFIPGEPSCTDARELLILRAIIAAANADGLVDRRQRLLILSRIEAMRASGRDKAFLADEVESPMSYEELAGFARSPEVAAVIYAASLVPLDTGSRESRAYLGALAQSMALPNELAKELARYVEVLNTPSGSAAVA